MSKLAGSSPAVVIMNGQKFTVDSWSLDIQQDSVDVTSAGGFRRMMPGRQSVKIELAGASGGMTAPPAAPREDIVKHLGTRCCCRHCPQEGNHA